MSLAFLGIGFVVGFFVGIGASLLYLRWKMKRQLGMMQNQMQDMMDMTQGMEEGLGGIDELDPEEVEDVEEIEEKEEN